MGTIEKPQRGTSQAPQLIRRAGILRATRPSEWAIPAAGGVVL